MNSSDSFAEHIENFELLSCPRTPQKPIKSSRSMRRKAYSSPIPSKQQTFSTPTVGKRIASPSKLAQYSSPCKKRRHELSESTATPRTTRQPYYRKKPWQIKALIKAYDEKILDTEKGRLSVTDETSLKLEQVLKWYYKQRSMQKNDSVATETIQENHDQCSTEQHLSREIQTKRSLGRETIPDVLPVQDHLKYPFVANLPHRFQRLFSEESSGERTQATLRYQILVSREATLDVEEEQEELSFLDLNATDSIDMKPFELQFYQEYCNQEFNQKFLSPQNHAH